MDGPKEHAFSGSISESHLPALNQRKHVSVGYGVLVTNYQKVFGVRGGENPCHEVSKQRKGRIRDDEIRFITERRYLFTAKITIFRQEFPEIFGGVSGSHSDKTFPGVSPDS